MYHSFKGWQVWPTKEKKIKTWLYCKGEGGQCLGAEVYFCVFGYEIIPVTSTD